MSESKYLRSLSPRERDELKEKLFHQQGHLCFICDKEMDLRTHSLDLDHKIAVSLGGPDDPCNFVLAHSKCNRSKGIRDLQLQRYIEQFRDFVNKKLLEKGINANITVGDVLLNKGGSKADVALDIYDDTVKISYESNSLPHTMSFQLIKDLKNVQILSFVGMIPKEIIFHDTDINPRSIADLEPMIEEFYQKRPQLQPSLAYITLNKDNKGKIRLFDGQHKAAAQLINGADKLLVRIFVNPDVDLINKTNFRAHTKLSQVHFPQLIADKVGHSIFEEEFLSFCARADIDKQSEKTFIDSLMADMKSEYRAYLKSYIKYDVLSSTALEIMKYVETISARSKALPLSFESLRRGLLEIFLYLKAAEEPLAETKKMRESERRNLQTILNILTEEVLVSKFDPSVGIFKIEERLKNKDPKVTLDHLLAYRMLRQSALIAWVEQFRTALNTYFNSRNKYKGNWSNEKYLWVDIDNDDMLIIRKMIRFVKTHPAWTAQEENVVKLISSTSVGDWRNIILHGKLPGATQAAYEPYNGGQILVKAATLKI